MTVINHSAKESQETKVCTECQTAKPLTEFHKQSASADGLHYKCKACIRVVYRRPPRLPKRLEWALSHPNTERGREWLVKHGVKFPQLVAMVKPADLDIPWLHDYNAQQEHIKAIEHRMLLGKRTRKRSDPIID